MNTNLTEDQLAAARFRALLDSPSHGIIAVDSRGTIQLASARAAELFGYERGELTGRKIEMLIPERARKIHAEEVREYSESPRSRPMGIGMEVRGRRRDGSEFPVEISLNYAPVGDQSMVLALVVDVSGRVEMEEQARRAQKMDAVGQLAGGAARDLDRLVAAISEQARTARDRCGEDAALRDSLDAISAAVNQVAGLSQQLRRIAGTAAGEAVWFDLNQKLSEMRASLTQLLGDRVRLDLDLEADLGEMLADPAQVEDVIINLVRNAGDAMPAGGVVTVETGTVEVGEALADWHLPVSPGPHIMVAVTDSGTGMTPADQAHLFEPYYKSKTGAPGEGLGLATVYGILKNCGGSIFVSSRPDEGTRFQVIFPRIRGN